MLIILSLHYNRPLAVRSLVACTKFTYGGLLVGFYIRGCYLPGFASAFCER